MSDLFWLTDEQIERLRPFFPKSHGKPRVDDRRVLSGIVFVKRNRLRWRDAPSAYGPHKPVSSAIETLYNLWTRLGRAERVHANDGRAGGGACRAQDRNDRCDLPEGKSYGFSPTCEKGGRTKGGLNTKLHATCRMTSCGPRV